MTDLLTLLLPTDSVQTVFWIMMLGLSLFSIIWLMRFAKPGNWEKNWNNNTDNTEEDDVDVDHGSVIELCQVITTKSEAFAEYLPGILLTLGLLGTFIGLAQSIGNAAQTIALSADQITAAGSSTTSLDEAMKGMLAMMQGMGTQFKTSIWGIIGFLGLKIMYGKLGFEKRRLKWTIRKMRSGRKQKEDSSRRFLKEMVKTLNDQIKNNTQTNQNGLDHLRSVLAESVSNQTAAIEKALSEKLFNPINVVLTETNKMLDKVVGSSEQTKKNTGIFCESIASFTDSSEKTLKTFREASTNLSKGVEELKNKLTTVMEGVKTDLNKSITTMSSSFEANLNKSSESLTAAVVSIKGSVDQMSSIISVMKKGIEEVLGQMKNDMGETVQQMNGQIKAATEGLQNAVGEMSGSVEKLQRGIENALAGFNDNMNAVMDLQKEAFTTFETSNQTTLVNIQALQGKMGDIASQLQANLSTVSSSNLQLLEALETFKQRFNEYGKIQTQLEGVIVKLDKVMSSAQDLMSKTLQISADDE